MRGIVLKIALLLAVPTLALRIEAQAIPTTEAETLQGQKLVLAATLRGHNTILVMSFSREAASASDAWAAALAAEPAFSGIPIYRAAMLEAAPGLVRSLIKSSLRRQLAASEQARYLIFSRDEKPWRAFLGVASDKQPVVALIGADGQLRWHGQGAIKDQMPQWKAALR